MKVEGQSDVAKRCFWRAEAKRSLGIRLGNLYSKILPSFSHCSLQFSTVDQPQSQQKSVHGAFLRPGHHVFKMTRPLAKRQRRLVPSDDDEPLAKPQHSPTGLFTGAKTALPERKPDKLSSTPKRAKTRAAINGSPRSSPRKASRAGVTEEKGNKSLNSFFTRATEEQRWARDEKTPLTGDADGEIGDAIEDDSLDEALVEMADRQANENKVLDRRKSAAVPSGAEVSRPLRDRHDSSQKFAKQAKTTSDRAGNRDPGQDADKPNQVWAERFAPTCLEELAVHRKKVTDVQNWLASVLQGQDRRVCEPQMHALRKVSF